MQVISSLPEISKEDAERGALRSVDLHFHHEPGDDYGWDFRSSLMLIPMPALTTPWWPAVSSGCPCQEPDLYSSS